MKKMKKLAIWLAMMLVFTSLSLPIVSAEEQIEEAEIVDVLSEEEGQETEALPASQDEATGEEIITTPAVDETAAIVDDAALADDLIIDEEILEEAEPEEAPTAEQEAEVGAEPAADAEEETGAETEMEALAEPESGTEAEAETEAGSEAETETETEEELLIEEEEETGTEEEEDLEAQSFALWINGTQVTSANWDDPTGDGLFEFDGISTLTVKKSGSVYAITQSAIQSSIDGLEIVIPEEVTLTLISQKSDAIRSSADLTITGKGRLNANSYDAHSCGIYMAKGNLVIYNTTVSAEGHWGITALGSLDQALEICYAEVSAVGNAGAICDFQKGGIKLKGCIIKKPSGGKIGDSNRSITESDGATYAKDVQIGLPDGYPVWVGETRVTVQNKNDILGDGGKAKYDPATKTLSLNNPSIKGTYISEKSGYTTVDNVIYSDGDLTVRGTLSVSGGAVSLIHADNGNLTLNANLTLTQTDDERNVNKYALAAKQVTIAGGTVKINCVDKYSYMSISASKLVMNGGTLELVNQGPDIGQITANGGTIKLNNSFLYADDVTIQKSNITGSGYIWADKGNIAITGSTINLTNENDAAVHAILGTTTITDSTVTLKGSIWSLDTLTIQNSTVSANGGNMMSDAIGSYGKVIIKGGSTVTATDGKVDAIWAKKGIEIDATHYIKTPAGGTVGSFDGGFSILSGGSVVKTAVITAKEADYSKVDAALKKIPANLGSFTDASAKKVTDAKNAVKRGYNISQQSQVDAMAKAIEDAIKALQVKQVKLVAAYNGAHGIGVKWVKLSGATEYVIWQKYQGVWKSIATVKAGDPSLQDGGSTLMYTDQTVKTGYGKGYIYSASAKIGSYSGDYDKAGVAIYRLNPPILKQITNKAANKVRVVWKGVFGKTETNGAYDLQYATEADAKAGKWTHVAAPLGHRKTSVVLTGLKKNTKYVFRIRCSKTNKDRGTFYSEYSPWLSIKVKQ